MTDLTASTRAAYVASKKPQALTFDRKKKLDTGQVVDQRKFTAANEPVQRLDEGGVQEWGWQKKKPTTTRSPAPTGSTPDKVAYAKNRIRMNETARLKRVSAAAEDLAFGGTVIGQSIPNPPKRKP